MRGGIVAGRAAEPGNAVAFQKYRQRIIGMIGGGAASQVHDAGKLTGRNMNDLEPRLAGTLIQPLPGGGAAAEEQRGEARP